MDSLTIDRPKIDNEIIEHLDFEHEQPCEHSGHNVTHGSGPAFYYIRANCPDCRQQHDYFICKSGWDHGSYGVLCHITGRSYPRNKIWTILREVHNV